MDIKEEFPFSEVISQTDSFSQDVTMKFNNDATVCNKICETEIKEEGVDSDLTLQNDWLCFSKDFVEKVERCHEYEMETKIKMNKECVDSDFCSQNERQFVSEVSAVKLDPCSKDSELDTKIKIKEEMLWLEGTSAEAPSVDDVTKDCVDESIPSTESMRLYIEETSRDSSTVLLNEKSSSNASFNTTQNSFECETNRKYTSKKCVIPEISSWQKHHDSVQMVGPKYNNFVQHSSLQVHELNKKNYFNKSVVRNVEGKNYKCGTCDNKFTSQSAFKIHKLTHGSIKPHKCDNCGKCFVTLRDLKTHKFSHEGIKPYKCDTCGKCFSWLANLKVHKLAHKGIKPHNCDTCDKRYTSLSSLKRHKLLHLGIKQHKCDICGKCFIHSSDLRNHKLIHLGIKPHKCDTCGKCFLRLSEFKIHSLAHERIKPHKCDICGKCFYAICRLKRHILTHEGSKPHKCDVCSKFFTRLSSLKQHKLIHLSIKPHKCDTCGRCFARLSNLKRHKLVHLRIKKQL